MHEEEYEKRDTDSQIGSNVNTKLKQENTLKYLINRHLLLNRKLSDQKNERVRKMLMMEAAEQTLRSQIQIEALVKTFLDIIHSDKEKYVELLKNNDEIKSQISAIETLQS